MKPISADVQHRLGKLRELVDLAGGPKKFVSGTELDASYISQLLNGHRNFGEKAARKVENEKRLQPRYFEPETLQTAAPSGAAVSVGNVSPGPEIRGMVPVISWVRAGSWDEAHDPLQPGDGDEWLPCPVRHSKHTYALRVDGDSMTAMSGRSYPEDCIIFVDPEQRACVPGDRVIAKLNGDSKVTFKQLASDGGRLYLRPLNQLHPPIWEPFRIIGKVIGMFMEG
jgi:SOS-response transcriptional repressor LexA